MQEINRRRVVKTLGIAAVSSIAPPLASQPTQLSSSTTTALAAIRVASESASLEWFFLVVDVGRTQSIWKKYGLDPQFVPAAGSATQLKERIDSGVKMGFVNAAEVTLARANGVPVKTIGAYFGETTARIFVAGSSSIKRPIDLDAKKIGIFSTTHTSYRTVLYMNRKLGINAEPVPLGGLESNLNALKAGQVDAFYSAEGAPLTLVDSGDLRVLVPLADIYPKPYAAAVVWATSDLIESDPDLVRRFLHATLETVAYIKEHPADARKLYSQRTGAAMNVADRAISSLNRILNASGRGSGSDLVEAISGNWRFMTESGAVSAELKVNIGDVVDARFLPHLKH